MFIGQVETKEILDKYPHSQQPLREQVKTDLENTNYVLLDTVARAVLLQHHNLWLEKNTGHVDPSEWLTCFLEVEGEYVSLHAYSAWIPNLQQAYTRYTCYMGYD